MKKQEKNKVEGLVTINIEKRPNGEVEIKAHGEHLETFLVLEQTMSNLLSQIGCKNKTRAIAIATVETLIKDIYERGFINAKDLKDIIKDIKKDNL